MKRIHALGLFLAILVLALPNLVLADDPPLFSDKDQQMDLGLYRELLLAQAPPGGPFMPGGDRPQMGLERRQQRKHLEQLRMLKMLELLDLGENQEVRFLIAFNAMRKEHRELDDRINLSIDSLALELHADDINESRVTDLTNRVLNLQNEKFRVVMDFAELARDILTPEQFGKFVIFQKRFESELLERIGRFREGHHKGPGGPPWGDG